MGWISARFGGRADCVRCRHRMLFVNRNLALIPFSYVVLISGKCLVSSNMAEELKALFQG